MKTLALGMLTALLFAGTAFTEQTAKTGFDGEIMDSACAKTGSHEAMMKQNPAMKTAKEYTIACVQHGARYVLYDAATATAYDLDDQKMPAQFAGEKVIVEGTLDESKHRIHVVTIKSAIVKT